MKLRFTRRALADLEEILDYIAERSPQGAAHVHARIRSVLDLIVRQPRVGGRTADPVIRRMVTGPYPYLIFYEQTGQEIVVHAIRHGARNPRDMPDKN